MAPGSPCRLVLESGVYPIIVSTLGPWRVSDTQVNPIMVSEGYTRVERVRFPLGTCAR